MTFSSQLISAQIRFEKITLSDSITSPFAARTFSSIAVGDVNNDGNLDVYVAGKHGNSIESSLYINSNSTVFTEDTNFSVVPVEDGTADFIDIDGDLDLDLLITGITGPSSTAARTTLTYKNDGNGSFSLYLNPALIPVLDADVTYGDFDGDEDIDLIIAGSEWVVSTCYYEPRLYLNDGLGNYSQDSSFTGMNVDNAVLCSGDIDNDGDLDYFHSGWVVNSDTRIGRSYKNDGNGNFVQYQEVVVGALSSGDVLFADMENDGFADLIVCGASSNNIKSLYYLENIGSGLLSGGYLPNLIGTVGSLDTADIDNDGDLDLLCSGFTSNGALTRLYENLGNGNFEEVLNLPFPNIANCEVKFGDLNNDGKIDVIMSGSYKTFAYLNLTCSDLAGDLNCNGVYDQGELVGDYNQNGIIDNNEIAGDINGTAVIDSNEVLGDVNNDGIGYDCLDYDLLNYIINTQVTTGNNSMLNAENVTGNYQWFDCLLGIEVSGETNQNFFPQVIGEYSVIINEENCSDTSICVPVSCLLETGVLSSGDTLLSLADSMSYTAYQWLNCDTGIPISGENGQSFTALVTGEYSVVVSQGNCLDTSDCTSICLLNTDVSLLENNTIESLANTLTYTFQWLNCNTGIPVTGEVGHTFAPQANGDYAVILSQGNCIDTSSCVAISNVSISDLNISKIQVYPNPSSGQVTVKLDSANSLYSISMFSSDGRIIEKIDSINENELLLSIDLDPGVYFLNISTSFGDTIRKVIVSK